MARRAGTLVHCTMAHWHTGTGGGRWCSGAVSNGVLHRLSRADGERVPTSNSQQTSQFGPIKDGRVESNEQVQREQRGKKCIFVRRGGERLENDARRGGSGTGIQHPRARIGQFSQQPRQEGRRVSGRRWTVDREPWTVSRGP
jgi:hypothetical protein